MLHTAPGLGCGVLAPAVAAGAIPLAVHPAMVFTGTSLDLVRLRESYCAVTAPTPVLPIGGPGGLGWIGDVLASTSGRSLSSSRGDVRVQLRR